MLRRNLPTGSEDVDALPGMVDLKRAVIVSLRAISGLFLYNWVTYPGIEYHGCSHVRR